MPYVSKTLGLVGHYYRQNVTLLGYRFVDGKCTIHGSEVEVEKLEYMFHRMYQAYDVTGQKYATKKELLNGQCDNDGDAPATGHETEGEVQSNGIGTSPPTADDSGTADGAEAGASEGVSDGDGHSHPGFYTSEKLQEAIAEAVRSLDPTNDKHWTQAGLPNVWAIQGMVQSGSVTRKLIDAAAPGFVRPGAEDKATE